MNKIKQNGTVFAEFILLAKQREKKLHKYQATQYLHNRLENYDYGMWIRFCSIGHL